MNEQTCRGIGAQPAPDTGSLIEYPVTDRVLLAGQPEPEDWERLARRGYQTVINIRSDAERAAIQAENAEAAGLRHVHLPVPAYELEPQHIDEFKSAIAGSDGKLIIHCRTASRVALLWMLDRIVNEGWSQDMAEAELRAAGYGDDDVDVFRFCAADFFERAPLATLEL